ncbi:endophilin-B1 isoform 3-T3 [Trichechus inunguis]
MDRGFRRKGGELLTPETVHIVRTGSSRTRRPAPDSAGADPRSERAECPCTEASWWEKDASGHLAVELGLPTHRARELSAFWQKFTCGVGCLQALSGGATELWNTCASRADAGVRPKRPRNQEAEAEETRNTRSRDASVSKDARIEEFVYEKLDRKAPSRINNPELLGQYMIDAGTEFGPGTAYGNALIKCGETQKRIGTADRELIQTSALNFLTPLRNFIEGDYKTIAKERKLLQNKRLDLDAAKTRLKKAKTADTRASSEQELRITQSEFDRQAEITRLLLEGISSTHAHHLRCLNDFVEAQLTYYAQCYQYMLDLQKQLGRELFYRVFKAVPVLKQIAGLVFRGASRWV